MSSIDTSKHGATGNARAAKENAMDSIPWPLCAVGIEQMILASLAGLTLMWAELVRRRW